MTQWRSDTGYVQPTHCSIMLTFDVSRKISFKQHKFKTTNEHSLLENHKFPTDQNSVGTLFGLAENVISDRK